ncbi:MAG TPA: ankyrin repeat domain-containing protein [Acidobacteriaceae bacterium]|nr:ankyrin repeat domain-containing protein [Acidobacteriaceae bacterium]
MSLLLLPPGHAQSALQKWKKQAEQKIQQQVDPNKTGSGKTQSATKEGTSGSGSGTGTTGATGTTGTTSTGAVAGRSSDAQSALFQATYRGDGKACEDAVARGADASKVLLRTTLENKGTTNLAIVRCLVEHGADVNKGSVPQNGRVAGVPLLTAIGQKEDEIAEYLVSKGADVNIRDSDGGASAPPGYCECTTPLMQAVVLGNPKMVQLLLAHGADAHLGYVNRNRPQGYSLLDETDIHLSAAASDNRTADSLASQQKLDDWCTINAALQAHGAQAKTSTNPGVKEACSRGGAEKAKRMEALQQKQNSADAQAAVKERTMSRDICAKNAIASFYSCECFSEKIADYRQQHPGKEPLNNIIPRVDYTGCVGPREAMAKYGYDRAQMTLKMGRMSPEQKEQIATCTGDGLPGRFMQRPSIEIRTIDSDFSEIFQGCHSRSSR